MTNFSNERKALITHQKGQPTQKDKHMQHMYMCECI